MDEQLEKEFAYHVQKQNTPYFEGWYYRVTCKDVSFAVIIGIQQNKQEHSSFIQILDTKRKTSSYHTFSNEQVYMKYNPFRLRMADNIFTKDYLHINVEGFTCDLHAVGFIHLDTNAFMPTIMGPFTYYKQMECIHSVISLYHNVYGSVKIQNIAYQIQGIGYIEKDRGVSFPSAYTWFQSNTCKEVYSSFFFSIASIPLKKISFIGCICVLMVNGKQLRFATYLGCRSKVLKNNMYVLFQYPYTLYLKMDVKQSYPLIAPCKGQMNIKIQESLETIALVHVYKHNKRIHDITFTHGGYEHYE